MTRLAIWDFDGTLASRRRETGWSLLLVEVLDEQDPGHGIDVDAFRPFLRSCFPWHTPDVAHPELSSPQTWWEHVEPLLSAAYEGVGYSAERACRFAESAHRRYVDPGLGWMVFEDAKPVLAKLAEKGWTHRILSNHVPELKALVAGLGLGDLVASVVSSADTGYEKPHPQAFAAALDGEDPQRTWMIGDNFAADVAGAEAVGLSAVLVRREHPDAVRFSPDLWGVERFLETA